MSDRSSEHRAKDAAHDHSDGQAADGKADTGTTRRDKGRMVAVQAGAYAMMVPWG